MLLPPPDLGAAYVDEAKRPSKDLYNWIKSLYDAVRGISNNTLFAGAVVVADLPPAGVVGRRHLVTNSSVVIFGDEVADGGTLIVPVYDDGTDWRVG